MIGNGGMFSINNAETLKNKIDYLIESKENIIKIIFYLVLLKIKLELKKNLY